MVQRSRRVRHQALPRLEVGGRGCRVLRWWVIVLELLVGRFTDLLDIGVGVIERVHTLDHLSEHLLHVGYLVTEVIDAPLVTVLRHVQFGSVPRYGRGLAVVSLQHDLGQRQGDPETGNEQDHGGPRWHRRESTKAMHLKKKWPLEVLI